MRLSGQDRRADHVVELLVQVSMLRCVEREAERHARVSCHLEAMARASRKCDGKGPLEEEQVGEVRGWSGEARVAADAYPLTECYCSRT